VRDPPRLRASAIGYTGLEPALAGRAASERALVARVANKRAYGSLAQARVAGGSAPREIDTAGVANVVIRAHLAAAPAEEASRKPIRACRRRSGAGGSVLAMKPSVASITAGVSASG